MNRLDQYIHNNKHLFDEEPETGHFERLQQKMNRVHRKTIMLRWSTAIAASVALLFSITLLWQNSKEPENISIICENSPDMKCCYLGKMNEMADQIDELTKDFDQWDRQQVMDDVQNIIDATQNGLENEIPEELPDATAKSILSDYYKKNIDGLNTIIKTLEQ